MATYAPMPPTGEQFEIVSGDVRAVVTEVGAGLRAVEHRGRPYVETFAASVRPPRGAGQRPGAVAQPHGPRPLDVGRRSPSSSR